MWTTRGNPARVTHFDNSIENCTLFKAVEMKRDDRVMAFIIGWILAPKRSNHAQLTKREIYLMFTLKAKIQTGSVELICDSILKAI